MPVKYALDTSLFIDAFRVEAEEAQLLAFHQRFAPAEYLAAVVVMELRARVRDDLAAARLERHVFRPFEQRGRLFAPSYNAWKDAGAAMADLGGGDGRSFCNDVLLAASCREHGVTLVTRNVSDFQRIRSVLRFDYVPAWP